MLVKGGCPCKPLHKGKLRSLLPSAPCLLGPHPRLNQGTTSRTTRAAAQEPPAHKAEPVIYSLGGVPGSGKTLLRVMSPLLCDAPFVDIGDKYERGARDHVEAADLFFGEAEGLLGAGHRKIVLEAFFSDRQRDRLQSLATSYDAQVWWIWCFAPRKVCYERVRAQAHEDSPARQQARLKMVQDLPDHFFQPRPGQYPP